MTLRPDIYSRAGLSDFPLPEYTVCLYAQACHETGFFTSNVWKEKRNLFGMKASCKRFPFWDEHPIRVGGPQHIDKINDRKHIQKTITCKEPGKYYASYSEPGLSLTDRLHWDLYNGISYTTASEYMDFVLAKGYAEDKDYKRKWVRILWQVCDANNLKRVPVRGFTDQAGVKDSIYINTGGDVVTAADNTAAGGKDSSTPGTPKAGADVVDGLKKIPWWVYVGGVFIIFRDRITKFIN